MMLLGMFVIRYHLALYAQTPRPELEKLAKDIVEPLDIQMSPDGKYALLFEINEDSKVSLIISETEKPFRKIRKTNVSKNFFLSNDVLVLQVGSVFQKIDLKSQKESEIQNIKTIDFLEDEKQLLIHYDSSKNNMLEIYDDHFILRKRIESVLRWQKTEGDLIIFENKGEKKNLLKVSSDGSSYRTIWSSENEVYKVAKSDTEKEGYVVSVSAAKGLKTYFVGSDLTIVELDDPSISKYVQITVKKSSDANAVFMTLSDRLPLDDQTVSIWYGKEQDLSNYFYGERPSTDILWYPEEKKVVRLDTNYIGYTGIGRSNLFLRKKKDRRMVDVKERIYRVDQEDIHLWNSVTREDRFLGKDGDVMYFDREGNFILRYIEANWKLLETKTMTDKIVEMPATAVPCFSLSGTILWSSKGELWEQNTNDLQKKKIVSVNADIIEILNKKQKSTEAGVNRRYQYMDDRYLLIATHQNNDLRSTYYMLDQGKKLVIVPESTDRIKHLQASKDGRRFMWTEENYNKPPVVMVKIKSSASRVVYQFNAHDIGIKKINKKQLYYKGVNNEDLQASLFLSTDFDSQKKYPVVLWIYEKQQEFTDKYLVPTFKNTRGFNARLLLESGYMVLMPDINYDDRGSALSALHCINNVMDELSKVEQVDMRNIALMGQSLGGYETNFIATQSNRFAAYISGAGASDIIHMANSFNYNFQSPDYYRFEQGPFKIRASFEENKQKYFDNNPLYHVSKVNAPMLLWTGTEDKNVDQEETRTFFSALRKYRKTVIALFYKGEAHTITQYPAQKDYTLRMLDWYDYFLRGKRDITWIDKQMKDAY
ncbi:Dipeptidyl-peptidase 5 [Chryseobacterium fistulae]|uniref:Dipeptidyl-peptidase 5 n=2 Tax=Chryseobacterium fistulae TaxID=2675058 RepID=A0A6N4XUX6_9FLAO|nr:Dipeptidyl-peptidase 5 [Chryseobacterium fistulae]